MVCPAMQLLPQFSVPQNGEWVAHLVTVRCRVVATVRGETEVEANNLAIEMATAWNRREEILAGSVAAARGVEHYTKH
jgi:hypothetical protein